MNRYMPEHMTRHGDWILGVGPQYLPMDPSNRGSWVEPDSVYLVDRDWKLTEVPIENPQEYREKMIVVENNPVTGEIFFSDRSNGFLLWKMTVFDGQGKPLQTAKMEKVAMNLEEGAAGSIDGLTFTPDGKVAIGIDDSEGAYAFPLNAGPKGVSPILLGQVQTGGMEVNFGTVGNDRVWLRKGNGLKVVPVDGSQQRLSIPLKDGYEEAFGSPDGKTLYVHYRGNEKKPYFEVHDLIALAANPRTAPRTFDAGHPKELGDWQDPVKDQIFFPPNSPYIIQSYMGQWRQDHDPKRQLRVIDPNTFKVVATLDLPTAPVGLIQKLRMSPDGTKIIGHQDRGDYNGSNAHIYQVDVASIMARVQGP